MRGWVERLGAVWVEAQLIEINRRSGTRTIFLTLRDKLAEVSVSVTTSPTTLDSAGPLTEGATVVARLKPSYYESSGRFIFSCDAITPIGEGRLLARLEQTKRLLQAEGLFDRSLKKSLPFLPQGGRARHRRRQRSGAGRHGKRAAALAGGTDRHPIRPCSGTAGLRAAHRRGAAPRPPAPRSRSSSSPAAAAQWKTSSPSPTRA